MDIRLNIIKMGMIKRLQCSGCVCGHDPAECSSFRPIEDTVGFSCQGWVPGTLIIPDPGLICLGLPKGFNIVGPFIQKAELGKQRYVNLFSSPEDLPKREVSATNLFEGYWNKLNVPVWAMEYDGYLFVKTYAPRKNIMWVSVIKGGTMALFDSYPDVPRPINVADFVDFID